MIKVLYFASLRERLGRADETLQEVPPTVAALRELLASRVNKEMATAEQVLRPDDEVGFFPPVTGG